MNELERMQFLVQKGWTYDPITGDCFTTRGKKSFVLNRGGYQQIVLSKEGKVYFVYAHRFAWYYVHKQIPKLTIDHINRDKTDNRIENLRDVDHGTNVRNRESKGYTVAYSKKLGTYYRAQIWSKGKYIFLGSFSTPEEASKKYNEAKIFYHKVKNKL